MKPFVCTNFIVVANFCNTPQNKTGGFWIINHYHIINFYFQILSKTPNLANHEGPKDVARGSPARDLRECAASTRASIPTAESIGDESLKGSDGPRNASAFAPATRGLRYPNEDANIDT